MIILSIRTDNPTAEIGLLESEPVQGLTAHKQLSCVKWRAHRELAETILQKIEQLIEAQEFQWRDIEGIVCYEGPGSFTGLRIGLTIGNTLAYSLGIPIVATGGQKWIDGGVKELKNGRNQRIITPEYGAPVRITKQKK